MNKYLLYLVLACLAILFQTTFLPLFLAGAFRPDLILILVVYLGLHEKSFQGGLLVYLIGWIYDGFSGSFAGLHGFVLLSVFLAVRAIVTRVNTESTLLLLLVVAVGTSVHFLLIAFALDFFRITDSFFLLTIAKIPGQIALNTFATLIIIWVIQWVQSNLPLKGKFPNLG